MRWDAQKCLRVSQTTDAARPYSADKALGGGGYQRPLLLSHLTFTDTEGQSVDHNNKDLNTRNARHFQGSC